MDWQSFIQSFAAFLPPFFGVLVAFLIERGWSWFEDRRAKKKILQALKRELKSCSDILQGIEKELVAGSDVYVQKGNLLPIDIWKSAVSSGSLKLIPHDRKFDFSSIYFRIECHNDNAEKIRDVGILVAATEEKADTKTGVRLFSSIEKLHNALSNRLRDSDGELKKGIDGLLKQNIWD